MLAVSNVKKGQLMILSQGSYGLCPAGNVMFRINNNAAKISNNLLASRAFVRLFCQPRNHVLAEANKLM